MEYRCTEGVDFLRWNCVATARSRGGDTSEQGRAFPSWMLSLHRGKPGYRRGPPAAVQRGGQRHGIVRAGVVGTLRPTRPRMFHQGDSHELASRLGGPGPDRRAGEQWLRPPQNQLLRPRALLSARPVRAGAVRPGLRAGCTRARAGLQRSAGALQRRPRRPLTPAPAPSKRATWWAAPRDSGRAALPSR